VRIKNNKQNGNKEEGKKIRWGGWGVDENGLAKAAKWCCQQTGRGKPISTRKLKALSEWLEMTPAESLGCEEKRIVNCPKKGPGKEGP